jgi:myo-inositol-1(or 4)-monophosphatase
MAVDQFLRERLAGSAPGYGWLSEESKDDRARLAAQRVWIVDPIDGTRAYIAGREDWSISAALVENGRPVAGAVFAPVHDEMFVAVAGQGTRCNGVAIGVSAGHDLGGARIAGPRHYLDRLAALAPGIVKMPKVHSLALRFVRVAQGEIEAALASVDSRDWDLAAADLLVHEAGGALTTLAGERLEYNRPDPVHGALVAAGSVRHRTMLALMRGRAAEFD